ncbi:hypothetical protein BC832DRAFT_267437 [Gaertneriomyces semiglobifer]|nr:hypothetical protein BC832DRAFT_267437 [Gaertneriomyces semiglobifer]
MRAAPRPKLPLKSSQPSYLGALLGQFSHSRLAATRISDEQSLRACPSILAAFSNGCYNGQPVTLVQQPASYIRQSAIAQLPEFIAKRSSWR